MPVLRGSTYSVLAPVLLGLLLLSGCSPFTNTEAEPELPPRIKAVESFAVYFSNPWRDTLTTFDLVVLDPDNRSTKEIQQLRKQGTLPIAYVNLGEAESYRYFFDQINSDWLLGPNPNWPNHYYVDARKAGWRRLLLNTVIPNIMDKGFQGLFFDMVDTALPGLYPETKPGMIRLIEDIRQAYPDDLLIMNNGLFLVDEVHPSLDALIVENVFTRYDFDANRYVKTAQPERDRLVKQLHEHRKNYGLRPFLLNYAGSSDSTFRTYAYLQAQDEDFLTFISTVELDTIFSSHRIQ
jgi:uncharacterized protein (TIGR01370 family)